MKGLLALTVSAAASANQISQPSAPPPSPFPIAAEKDRAGQSSATTLAIEIDDKGKFVHCLVTQGSGSDFLDKRACEIIGEKGKFERRRHPQLKAFVGYTMAQRIVWRIEE